jgi:hypothetical protein
VALSVATSWMLAPTYMNTVMKNPVAATAGVAIPASIVFVFGFIGVIWSALWRERTIGRVAHAARRLKPDQRDKVFAEITEMLGAKAAAEEGASESRSPSETVVGDKARA